MCSKFITWHRLSNFLFLLLSSPSGRKTITHSLVLQEEREDSLRLVCALPLPLLGGISMQICLDTAGGRRTLCLRRRPSRSSRPSSQWTATTERAPLPKTTMTTSRESGRRNRRAGQGGYIYYGQRRIGRPHWDREVVRQMKEGRLYYRYRPMIWTSGSNGHFYGCLLSMASEANGPRMGLELGQSISNSSFPFCPIEFERVRMNSSARIPTLSAGRLEARSPSKCLALGCVISF